MVSVSAGSRCTLGLNSDILLKIVADNEIMCDTVITVRTGRLNELGQRLLLLFRQLGSEYVHAFASA